MPASSRLATLIPDSPLRPYDIREAIRMVVDDGEFFEVQEAYAQNLVVGFAQLDGHAVGMRPVKCVIHAVRSYFQVSFNPTCEFFR